MILKFQPVVLHRLLTGSVTTDTGSVSKAIFQPRGGHSCLRFAATVVMRLEALDGKHALGAFRDILVRLGSHIYKSDQLLMEPAHTCPRQPRSISEKGSRLILGQVKK